MVRVQRKKRNNEEETIQSDYITCVRLYENKYPQLSMILHIPNGGQRSLHEGAIFKKLGVSPGAPDIAVFVPSPSGVWGINNPPKGKAPDKKYHALFIEFKSKVGTQKAVQKSWENSLTAYGYKYEIHRSWISAWNSTVEYLELPKTLIVL